MDVARRKVDGDDVIRYDFVDSVHGRDAAPAEDEGGEFVTVKELCAWLNSILDNRRIAPRHAVRELLKELE